VGFSQSAASAAALRWALGESHRRACGVTVLHVVDLTERADASLARTSLPDGDAGRFLDRVSGLVVVVSAG